jgi:hypothetical protein
MLFGLNLYPKYTMKIFLRYAIVFILLSRNII